MTLKSILEKTGKILGLELDFSSPTETEELLIECGKDVVSVLCGEYVDLKDIREIGVSGNRISYSAFPNLVKKILRVEQNGVDVDFEVFTNYIAIPETRGTCRVKYTFIPNITSITQNLELPSKFTEYVMATGVAAEYCLRKGLYTEAEIYAGKYNVSLKNIMQINAAVRIGR